MHRPSHSSRRQKNSASSFSGSPSVGNSSRRARWNRSSPTSFSVSTSMKCEPPCHVQTSSGVSSGQRFPRHRPSHFTHTGRSLLGSTRSMIPRQGSRLLPLETSTHRPGTQSSIVMTSIEMTSVAASGPADGRAGDPAIAPPPVRGAPESARTGEDRFVFVVVRCWRATSSSTIHPHAPARSSTSARARAHGGARGPRVLGRRGRRFGADRAASAPNMSFDDMLKQAGEIKQRQMRDKRRAWEATAEFMKNTIA